MKRIKFKNVFIAEVIISLIVVAEVTTVTKYLFSIIDCNHAAHMICDGCNIPGWLAIANVILMGTLYFVGMGTFHKMLNNSIKK